MPFPSFPALPTFASASTPCQKRLTQGLCLAAVFVFVLTALWAILCVPMCNDEAMDYGLIYRLFHRGADLPYAFYRWNHVSDLATPFGLRWPRSTSYMGATASLLYLPFYALWRAPESFYLVGLLFFLAFAYALAKLTEKPALTFVLTLAFSPFSFNFIHDSGPVKFAALLFPVGAWLLRRALASQGRRAYLYAAALAALTFLAVEEKLYFVYLLPSYALFLLAFAGSTWRELAWRLSQAKGPLLTGAALFLTLFGLMLISTKAYGVDHGISMLRWIYGMWKGEYPVYAGYPMVFASLGEKWFRYLFFWQQYYGHAYGLDWVDRDGNLTVTFATFAAFCSLPSLWLSSCIAMGAARWGAGKTRRMTPRFAFLSLALLVDGVVFSLFKEIWANHHFIYLWIPAIMLFADLIAQVSKTSYLQTGALVTLYLLANLVATIWMTQQPLPIELSPERDSIRAYIDQRASQKPVVDYETWGGDLYHALYAPPEVGVVFYELVVPSKAKAFMARVQTFQRPLYIACNAINKADPSKVYMDNVCEAASFQKKIACAVDRKVEVNDVLPSLQSWKLFQVTLGERQAEPEGEKGRDCAPLPGFL